MDLAWRNWFALCLVGTCDGHASALSALVTRELFPKN